MGGNGTASYLTNGVLTLNTSSRRAYNFYTYGPNGIDLSAPLTIEFGARFVSSTSADNVFSPMMVYFCLGNGLGGAFYLGADDVWLAGPSMSRGASTSIDTDNFLHTYRIEVSGLTSGSSVNVFYDNVAAPLLSSTLVNDMAVYGNAPQIGFGDKSSKDSGQSEWAFLWHNAACAPISSVPEPTAAGLVISSLAVLALRHRRQRA